MNPETAGHEPALTQVTALRRYGQPTDIASVVAFLTGPDASFITSATLNVDGGLSA